MTEPLSEADLNAIDVHLRMLPDGIYMSTPHVLALIAEVRQLRRAVKLAPVEAIDMFLEYRDVHGYADEQVARAKAINEIAEGFDAMVNAALEPEKP
jgi:hypothetical protein